MTVEMNLSVVKTDFSALFYFHDPIETSKKKNSSMSVPEIASCP